MSTQSNKKTNSFIFIVILVVALGLVVNSFNNAPKSDKKTQNQQDTPNPENSSNQGGMDIDTKSVIENSNKYIYYVIKGTGFTDIYKYNLENLENKKVFTDRDEQEKIKAISGLNDQKTLMLTSKVEDEFANNIYLLSLDGSGKKEKKIPNFSSPQTPILSPDGKRIAYVLFSNAESDFGFKLLISDLNGENKQELTHDQTNLILYNWSPSGKLISFGKGLDNDVYQINLDNNQEEKILASSGEQIYYISYANSEDKFLLSKGPKGNNLFNRSEIYFLSKNDKLQQITSDSVYNYSIFAFIDNQYLYINKDYNVDNSENSSEPGQMIIYNTQNNNFKEIIPASQIIGWSN